jgi:hypothetical protein
MKLSELMHKIVDGFKEYDAGQITSYEIEGDDCEIEDSFDIDFSVNTLSQYNIMLRVYYTDDFKLRNVIKLAIKSPISQTVILLLIFAKMKYYKSIVALQFYHLACRRIKYDTYFLLYSAYERNDVVAFESILNGDLKTVYESSNLAKNAAIDMLFRYNYGETIFDITEQSIDDLIEECSGEPAFVAVLLNYKNRNFGFDNKEDISL